MGSIGSPKSDAGKRMIPLAPMAANALREWRLLQPGDGLCFPARSGQPFQLALDIHASDGKDLALLHANGWALADPRAVAGDPWAYQAFIRGSKAEFLVAKNLYVRSNSGWFSDRSLCYLASGRPVLG